MNHTLTKTLKTTFYCATRRNPETENL